MQVVSVTTPRRASATPGALGDFARPASVGRALSSVVWCRTWRPPRCQRERLPAAGSSARRVRHQASVFFNRDGSRYVHA